MKKLKLKPKIIRKDLLETQAQQKTLRGVMKGEVETFRKDLKREVDKARDKSSATPNK